MRRYKEIHGESVIPEGCYCYWHIKDSGRKTKEGLPILESDFCPYWDIDDSRPEQMNGYCWYMEIGDWEDGGGGLLWDQCKECGIKDYDLIEE
jgi:hypothetical protein